MLSFGGFSPYFQLCKRRNFQLLCRTGLSQKHCMTDQPVFLNIELDRRACGAHLLSTVLGRIALSGDTICDLKLMPASSSHTANLAGTKSGIIPATCSPYMTT